MTSPSLFIGRANGLSIEQSGFMSNRHGLVSGATGTGKTVTLQVLAEGFSRMGVPVFAADIKGDLSGIAACGSADPKINKRIEMMNMPSFKFQGCPSVFWDIFGEKGHPVRVTISDMGPLLLSNLLELNEVQTGVLYSGFKIADEQGLLLLDLKDLRALLAWMGENSKDLTNFYGNITSASIGAIQRRLLVLEEQRADLFFGEPALLLDDIMHRDFSGRGVVSIFDASRLIHVSPGIYAAFLLWLLSELFEKLPEKGDLARPELILFFDEAHLLFKGASKPLKEKIEQVIRLIRSKGVGIYFVTQTPLDIPVEILGQLGLKVQHALRSFTPDDQKTIKAVSRGFTANPSFDTENVIKSLGIGEALVSVLDMDGRPKAVERTVIAPPEGKIGPLSYEERLEIFERPPLKGRYDKVIDRESAYELLKSRTENAQAEESWEKEQKRINRDIKPSGTAGKEASRQSVGETMLKSTARTIGNQLGKQIVRGILGSIFNKRK